MRWRFPTPLACAVVFAAAIATCGTRQRRIPDGATIDDRRDDRIMGVVGGPLVRTSTGIGAPLDTGSTVVWIWTGENIEPGQRVVAVGWLRTPRGSWSPGAIDRGAVIASRGAEWEMTARHIEVLGDDGSLSGRIWRWADGMQREWSHRIPMRTAKRTAATGTNNLDATGKGSGSGNSNGNEIDSAAAALRGIVVGDRSDIPPDLDQRWRVVGIYHVLSVSGLHLAVVAGLAFFLLCRLIAASPIGARVQPARVAALPALALAIAYTLVTGAQLATLRALVVVAIVFIAKALDRPLRLVDALGLAAIVILVWRPQDLYDPSFQLSFVAALTLALRPRQPAPADDTRTRRAVRWLRNGIATSAWVALTTAPLTAFHFQHVAIGGVVGNLVLTPLVELLALPLGLAGIVLGLTPLVTIATWIVWLVDEATKLLAQITPTGAIAIASDVVVIVLVVIAIVLAVRVRRTRVDVALWCALCLVWTLARSTPPPGALRVTFLDVGQGDAAIVELPNGKVWLIDAGGIASAKNLASASKPGETIERALAVYGHSAIDLAIVSHPHPDHYLGLARLTVPVRELWFVDREEPKSTRDDDAGRHGHFGFGDIVQDLAARGTRLATPPLGALREAGVELAVWAPRFMPATGARETLAPDPVRSVNDNSLVVTVSYAGRTLLFAGDLEAEGEAQLVAAGIGAVDVVKVAHHGSPTSSSRAFVAATRPELAVVSCGVANAFGFPSAEVVERWRAVGTRVERTDLGGALTVTVPADGALVVERFVRPNP